MGRDLSLGSIGLAVSALVWGVACMGELGGATSESGEGISPGDKGPTFGEGPTLDPPGVPGVGWTTRYPRLSHPQWENTVRDLLHLTELPGLASTFSLDPDHAAFDTYVVRTVTGNLWSDYQRAAESVAAQVVSEPELVARLGPPGGSATAEGGRAFIEHFGKRAFRRPLSEDEVTTYLTLFENGAELLGESDAYLAGVEMVLRAFLQSPFFLYRVESSTETDEEADRIWLDDFEVASRLSYGLWNTMPSDELLAAAEAGGLSTEAQVRDWTAKVLADARADAALRSFHEQLFHIHDYGTITKNATLFPTFTLELAPVLQEEAERFIDVVSVQEDGGIAALLTTPITFVNEQTAPFYGLSGSFGPELTQVDLDPTRRAGLLTQIGFLSRYGSQTQSDPILRGVHISLELLCSDLPPPPNGVPPLPAIEEGQTNRGRVEQATSVAPCDGCHKPYINPLGFAFENYDAVGSWRDTDNGLPVDASDSFIFDGEEVSYNNAVELSAVMAESGDLHSCYAQKWLEYVLGRPPAREEVETVLTLSRLSQDTTSVRGLLAELTALDTFRARPPEIDP